MIQTLIDRPDSFEVIRDKIALILATESAEQQALAIAEGKDPKNWELQVYVERSNAWDLWQDDEPANTSPIVNVWFDGESFPRDQGDTVERQTASGTFNIDVLGYGVATSTTEGHEPGDRAAALEAQRGFRLVRSILMASQYTYLELRGLVGGRWPGNVSTYQPQIGQKPAQSVQGVRLALQVNYNEFSPQYVGEILELLSVTINSSDTGQVLIEADYPST